jgi:thioredoxin type arsenate reductase
MSQIRVLFLCTGNSARSVIAEALLKSIGGGDFEVYSAGTHPKGINPFTVRVLQQAGLDPSEFHSKSMNEYVDQKFDYVITVCDNAAEECPIFPGDPERIHWSFTDPAAVEGTDLIRLTAFQQTLREMRQRLEAFLPVARRAFAEA